MKKIILSVVTILFLLSSAYASFCCKDPETSQDKCWNIGQCCGGFWYTSCYDFDIRTQSSRSFVVGRQTPVVVYIENTGSYTDSYTLTGLSDNPLILIDMSGAGQVSDLGSGEIKKVYPRITVLSNTAIGTVTFTATSISTGTQKSAILNILESDNYLSLPEFSLLGIVTLMMSIWVVYFLNRKQRI